MTDATELSEAPRFQVERDCGQVQPWGGMMILSGDWRIDAVSDNIGEFMGADPPQLLGQPVASVFSSSAVHAIRNRFALLGGSGGAERLYNLPLTDGGRQLDVLVRLKGQQAVAELFPATDPEGIDVAAMLSRMAAWIEGCENQSQLGERATHAVRGVIGCDSVSLWRSRGQSQPQTIACYARSGFECPSPPPGPLAEHLQFLGSCQSQPKELVLHSGSRAPDLSATLLGGDLTEFRDYACSTGAASAFSVPLFRNGSPWGWMAGLQRHERPASLARLSVIEIFAKLLASEMRRLEDPGP